MKTVALVVILINLCCLVYQTKKLIKLIIIGNNNHQCVLKGKPFMDEKDRVIILQV